MLIGTSRWGLRHYRMVNVRRTVTSYDDCLRHCEAACLSGRTLEQPKEHTMSTSENETTINVPADVYRALQEHAKSLEVAVEILTAQYLAEAMRDAERRNPKLRSLATVMLRWEE